MRQWGEPQRSSPVLDFWILDLERSGTDSLHKCVNPPRVHGKGALFLKKERSCRTQFSIENSTLKLIINSLT